ncbi:MAG: FAD-dependent oxidoreductase [Oscillospiraceae bacterium]|nr:FAD-dependent oxidoreductase [Oscillospiraceae bacterium]
MPNPYPHLLTPYQLTDNIALKNKIISPNVIRGHSQGPETWPADPQFADCTKICTSGAAMFSYRHYAKFGGGAAHRGIKDNRAGFDYDNAQLGNYMEQLAAHIHMVGSKVLVKLEQVFPDGMTLHGGNQMVQFPPPSGMRGFGPPPGMKLPTLEELKAKVCPKERFPEVIDNMIALMRRYVGWGFDGMSLRCDRYIDASLDLREDEYGGSLENRARFTYELFSAMKQEFGPDFIIEGAMPGSQVHGDMGGLPLGYTLEDTIKFAKMMEGVIDVLQIRNENATHYHATGYDSVRHDHQSLEFCRAIKAAGVKMTLAANSGFVEPEDLEAALASGACDLISAGRALIAEPEYTKKLAEGRKIVPCIQCNKCHGEFTDKNINLPFCSVNPESGIYHREHYTFKPANFKKKVAVIGGGLIGMRAAILAAENGHSVTLYEKSDRLGGKARYAALYSFKWPIQRYLEWLTEELKTLQVDVRLNCEPAPSEMDAESYDAIIACTGSVAKRPPVKGVDGDGIYTSEDIYMERVPLERLGNHVAVVGGSTAAVETAMYLAAKGKKITLVTRGRMLAADSRNPHDGIHATFMKIDPEKGYGGMVSAWEIYDDFNVIYKARTTEVGADHLTYETSGGETRTVACDSVIVNGGYAHCQKEAFQYAACAPMFFMAGDVEDCGGDIQKGNVSAYGKVNLL